MYTHFRVIAGLAACLVASCDFNARDDAYCEHLHKTAEDPKIREELESWVYQNVAERNLLRKDIEYHTRFVPGMYSFDGNFDWELLGFDQQRAKVNLVGPSPGDFTGNDVAHIKSVLFAERSRFGILVKLPESEDFGLGSDSQYLSAVASNISVLCMD